MWNTATGSCLCCHLLYPVPQSCKAKFSRTNVVKVSSSGPWVSPSTGREQQIPFNTSCSHRYRLLQWNFLNIIQGKLREFSKTTVPTRKMLNFSSAAQCWELLGNPFIHDQMFSVVTLWQLTCPVACLPLATRDIGSKLALENWGPYKQKTELCVSVASWFSPATRQGREWWKKGTPSHQSFWRQGVLLDCVLNSWCKFLYSFLFGKKGGLCLVDSFFFNLCLNHQTFCRWGGHRRGWLRQ